MNRELQGKIDAIESHPVYITITYLDSDGELQHWQQMERGFHTDDILPSLVELAKAAKRDLLPRS